MGQKMTRKEILKELLKKPVRHQHEEDKKKTGRLEERKKKLGD
jgi:hypothetical protein